MQAIKGGKDEDEKEDCDKGCDTNSADPTVTAYDAQNFCSERKPST